MSKKNQYRKANTGGTLLPGAGRASRHESRARPCPKLDRKRWKSGKGD